MNLVGLDVGTSQVKAVRFDDAWQAVDVESETTEVLRGPGGTSEQDMDQVWSAAARALSAVAGRCEGAIDLVAVTAQGDGCWLVDDGLRPVGPALLWNDSRAASLIEGWQGDGTLQQAFAINGSLGAPGSSHALLRWLDEHDADRLDRARWLLSCGSWVFACLTGQVAVDASEAANPFCDVRSGDYDRSLLEMFGLDAHRSLLPPVTRGEDSVAGLGQEVAAQLGLPAGTPVVLTPYDVVSTAIGAGTSAVGDGYAVLGTTLCVGVVDQDPRLDRPANGMTLPMPDPDRWLIAYATMTGTETLHWATRLLNLPDVDALGALARESTRSDPPLLLPYLSLAGERAPFLDAQVRGSLLGLDLQHTPADVARSVFDGLTLAVLDCVDAAGRADSLALSGGGARSETWCQAICDAVGVPVVRPDTPEVGARGAVLVGAVATGLLGSLAAATAAAVRPPPPLLPDEERTAWFSERYRRMLDARGGRDQLSRG